MGAKLQGQKKKSSDSYLRPGNFTKFEEGIDYKSYQQ